MGVIQFEASVEVAHRQLSSAEALVTTVESAHYHHRVFIDDEVQKCDDFEAL